MHTHMHMHTHTLTLTAPPVAHPPEIVAASAVHAQAQMGGMGAMGYGMGMAPMGGMMAMVSHGGKRRDSGKDLAAL